MFKIDIKKQGGGYTLFCNNIAKIYGLSAKDIYLNYRMFRLGLETAGGKSELTNESYGVLNEAELETEIELNQKIETIKGLL